MLPVRAFERAVPNVGDIERSRTYRCTRKDCRQWYPHANNQPRAVGSVDKFSFLWREHVGGRQTSHEHLLQASKTDEYISVCVVLVRKA